MIMSLVHTHPVNYYIFATLIYKPCSYASSESKRIHNMAAAMGVSTALKAAEERLKSLSWETSPPSTEKLR